MANLLSTTVNGSLLLGSSNTAITSTDATGYVRFIGSGGNYLAVGSYNNNGWGYIESVGNSNGLYLYTVNGGRFAFDNGDVTPYTDAENSLGTPSYRWAQVYTSGWFRNYGAQGMYNQDYGTHFYSNSGNAWVVTGSGGTIELQFRSNHQSTLRGYVYADTSNNIGFLNSAGNWSLQTTDSQNAILHGNRLNIERAEGQVTFKDADNTWTGYVGFNGNTGVLSFPGRNVTITSGYNGTIELNTGTDGYNDGVISVPYGRLHVDRGYISAPIYYDANDGAYYTNPASSSRMRNLYVGDAGSDWVDTGGWGTQFHVSNGPHSIFKVFARNEGIETGMFSHVGGQSKAGSFSNHDFAIVRNWDTKMTFYSGYTYANGYLQAADSFRAPIFYDSADNSYYGDFAGYSRMSEIGVTNHYTYNYHEVISSRANSTFGHVALFRATQSATSDYIPFSFESSYGNHSWGQVARFHIGTDSGGDRPSIQFSTGHSNTRWNIGYCYNDDNFRITQNMGYRPDMSGVYDNWGTERFIINTSGNVGIGTTSPEGKLHVASSSSGGIGGQIVIDNPASSALGNTAEISFLTDTGASGTGTRNARILAVNENAGNGAANMQFHTWNGAASAERMRITSAGNVGIGTTSPAYRLDVEDSVRFRAGIKITENTSSLYSLDGALSYYSTTNGVYLNGAGTSGWLRLNASGAENDQNSINIYGASAGAYMNFRTRNVTAMTINSSGNVVASVDMRAPIFYDSQDTGYYVDPNSTSRMYQINYDYLYYAPDTNYGFLGTNVYADTINSGYNSDALELVYHRGTEVRVGRDGGNKDIRAGRFVNGVDTTYYIDLDNTAASMYAAGYIKAKSTYRYNSTAGLPGQDYPVKTASGVLATFSASGGSYPYIIIKTRIPQDWYQMGGFTIDLFGRYNDTNAKTTITLGGYWNPESNSGFLGFEYTTTNPNVRPDITVMRDITDGMTCFVISGMTWNHPQVVARDLFLGYQTTDIEGGLDWSIFGADDLGGYTNNDPVICRNAIPADQWYGNTYIHYDGRHYGTIFYDSSDTNYYCDPNGTSRLNKINDDGGDTYGYKYFFSNKGSTTYLGSSDNPSLQAFCNDQGPAFMSFHRSGYYAVNFGLDPDNVIRLGGWSASANRMQLDMSGNVTFAGDVTAYSDARIKTNVQTIENALDKTLKLRGVTYNRTDSEDTSTKVGVIAQEILEVIPEVVNQDASGMYNVSYGNLTAVLIEAIKEQQKQIDELKEIINGLTK